MDIKMNPSNQTITLSLAAGSSSIQETLTPEASRILAASLTALANIVDPQKTGGGFHG